MRFCQLMIAACIMLVAASAAFAVNGILPLDRNTTPVQNVHGNSATSATSRCDTHTGTSGVFQNYSTSGYVGIDATVVSNTGAPVNVQWYQNGALVWVGPTFSISNNLGLDTTSIGYAPYAGSSQTLTSCVRRQ